MPLWLDRRLSKANTSADFSVPKVTNNASFVEDLGADSLDTVELVMALEEELDTEIPEEEAEKITTGRFPPAVWLVDCILTFIFIVQAAIGFINGHRE